MTLKLIYGKGINDSVTPVTSTEHFYVNGIRKSRIVGVCNAYRTWKSMFERCYGNSLKHSRTYSDCTVCDEWLRFSNFKVWYEQQDYKGKHLDKDLLIYGNTIYSPERCVFVTNVVNSFICVNKNKTSALPCGVHYTQQGYKSQISNPFTQRRENLGFFSTPQEAHAAWKRRKHELACELADLQTDERVANALRARYAD